MWASCCSTLPRHSSTRPAVFVPRFNAAERLPRTLESLRRQSLEVDVVVADNGPVNGSATIVRERYPEVHLVELRENLGFGSALDLAFAAVGSRKPRRT